MSAAVISDPDRDTQIAALTAALATAKAELAARDLLIETLRVQIARMRRMAFGASSEKLSAEIAQLELALEELEAAAVVTAIVSPSYRPCPRPIVRCLCAPCPITFLATKSSSNRSVARVPARIAAERCGG